MKTIKTAELQGLKLFRRGKVRDVYDLGDTLLIVVTDRISAFDVIMPNPIPWKGAVLNQIAAYWFVRTESIVRNHLISKDVDAFPDECQPFRDTLAMRSMHVIKSEALPVECVVRGYISGSGWNDYVKTGSICGIALPKGLKESEQLPEPIFTPTTKADQGHDVSMSYAQVESRIGRELAKKIRQTSLHIYSEAQKMAAEKGIIIADTKMEFGIRDGELILIDELLTPDSSRFWPADQYKPGGKQPSFDKQFLRDYLLSISWDTNTPPPELPEEIVIKTSKKYREALFLLTGIHL